MRIKVTHLRIVILVTNLLLGLGVPAYAYYNYFHKPLHRPPSRHIETELSKFRPPKDDGAGAGGPDSPGQVSIVDEWINPKPPPPPETGPGPGPGDGADTIKATTPASSNELQPGKLGDEGWVYDNYLIRRDDPLKTVVFLRKKDALNPVMATPGIGPGGPSSRTSTKGRPSTPVTGRTKARTSKGPAQPLASVSFAVGLRQYVNDELALDFMIDSADDKQFVYWLRENPKQMYALKYREKKRYDSAAPKTILAPVEKTPEEKEQEAAEKKPRLVKGRAKDFESAREDEYKKLREGVAVVPGDTPSAGELITPRGSAQPAGAADAGAGAKGAPPPAATPGKGPVSGPRKMTNEDRKQLHDALKDIPKDAQKEILDGLRKGTQNAPK